MEPADYGRDYGSSTGNNRRMRNGGYRYFGYGSDAGSI